MSFMNYVCGAAAILLAGNALAHMGANGSTDRAYGIAVRAASDTARDEVRDLVMRDLESHYQRVGCASIVRTYNEYSPWYDAYVSATRRNRAPTAELDFARSICGPQTEDTRASGEDPVSHDVNIPFSYERHRYTGIWPFGQGTIEQESGAVGFSFQNDFSVRNPFYASAPATDGEGGGYMPAMQRLRAEREAGNFDNISWLGGDFDLVSTAYNDGAGDRPTAGYFVTLSGLPRALFGTYDNQLVIDFVRDETSPGPYSPRTAVYRVSDRLFGDQWHGFMPPRPDGYGVQRQLDAPVLEEPR